jgi:hypothetical protein
MRRWGKYRARLTFSSPARAARFQRTLRKNDPSMRRWGKYRARLTFSSPARAARFQRLQTARGRAARGPVPPRAEVGAASRVRAIGQKARACWGGEWPAGRGGRAQPRPRFRSTSSAVARRVMSARSLRRPPQGHFQTSASKVWRWRKAQSTRGRFCLAPSAAGAREGTSGEGGGGGEPGCALGPWRTTRARSFEWASCVETTPLCEVTFSGAQVQLCRLALQHSASASRRIDALAARSHAPRNAECGWEVTCVLGEGGVHYNNRATLPADPAHRAPHLPTG